MSAERDKPLILPLFAPSIRDSWVWSRLDDVATIFDCPHSTPLLVQDDSSPFVVRSQDVRTGVFLVQNAARVSLETYRDRIRRVEPRFGDLLYSREGTYFGIAAEVPKGVRVCLGQRMVLIRPDISKVHYAFLKYWLNSPQISGHIHGFRDGTVAERLNLPVIRGLAVAFPSLVEQVKIAGVLAVLDDRIALLREISTTLESIAQALYKSWFIDFDPVHDKSQGKDPVGLGVNVASLFPSSFEESSLGLLPMGWKYSTLGETFTLTMGQSPPGDTYNESGEGLPFYQGRTDFGFRFPTKRVFCSAPTRLAKSGDTLVSVRAPVGDVNIALEPCALGRGVASIRDPKGHQSYAFYTVRNLTAHFKLYDGEGTVFGSINKKDFQSLPVFLPNESILEAFENLVAPLDAGIESNEHRLRVLTQLRDTLLPRLISGQLCLSKLESSIESTLWEGI